MIAQSLHSFTACIGCWKIWFQNFWEPEATAPAQCTINYNKSSRTPRPLLKENLDTLEIGNILKFIWQRMLQTRSGWGKTTHDLKNKTVTTPKAKFLSFLWSKLLREKKKKSSNINKGPHDWRQTEVFHKNEIKELHSWWTHRSFFLNLQLQLLPLTRINTWKSEFLTVCCNSSGNKSIFKT